MTRSFLVIIVALASIMTVASANAAGCFEAHRAPNHCVKDGHIVCDMFEYQKQENIVDSAANAACASQISHRLKVKK